MTPHEVIAAKFQQLEAMAADPSLTSAERRIGILLLGAFEVVGQGVSLGRTPFTIHAPPPEQGEHTDAILGKLGYDGEAIAGLHEDGVI